MAPTKSYYDVESVEDGFQLCIDTIELIRPDDTTGTKVGDKSFLDGIKLLAIAHKSGETKYAPCTNAALHEVAKKVLGRAEDAITHTEYVASSWTSQCIRGIRLTSKQTP